MNDDEVVAQEDSGISASPGTLVVVVPIGESLDYE